MTSAVEYWRLVLDNVVLLIALFPLLGACVVAALARAGDKTVRRVAIASALATLGLSLLMVANYDPHRTTPTGEPVLYQMTTSIGWLRRIEEGSLNGDAPNMGQTAGEGAAGLDIRFSVGVDGISLWFVLLTAVLMLPAIDSAGRRRELLWAEYAVLLLLQSALAGVFVATDVIGFCGCLSAVAWLVFFVIGHWGGYERRTAARRVFAIQQAAAVLALFGATAMVMSYSWMTRATSLTFSIPEFIEQIPRLSTGGLARQYWANSSGLIFAALLVGFAIILAAVPMHRWLVVAGDQGPTSALVLLIGVGTKIGCYGLARFCVPLFPNLLPSAVGVLSIVAIAGSMYAALVSLAQGDMRKLAMYGAISQQSLCAAGIFSLNLIGISGGLLHALGQGLCFAAFVFLIDALQRRHGSVEIAAYGGLAFARPRFGFCFLIVCLGATIAPGLCGFAGQSLTLLGVLRGHPAIGPRLGLVAIGLISQAVLAWAFLSFAKGCLLGPNNEPAAGRAASPSSTSTKTLDLGAGEVATLLPALLLIVSIGIWPNFFLERMAPSVSRMLHPYGTTIADEPSTTNKDNDSKGSGAAVSIRNAGSGQYFATGDLPIQSETEPTP